MISNRRSRMLLTLVSLGCIGYTDIYCDVVLTLDVILILYVFLGLQASLIL